MYYTPINTLYYRIGTGYGPVDRELLDLVLSSQSNFPPEPLSLTAESYGLAG
jgi:hypothetical protein